MAELTHGSTYRKTICELVARNPLVSFVFLSYAISWTCWLLLYVIDLGAVNGFGMIAGAGPALGAMLVSALQKPEPSSIPTSKRWPLFALVAILVFGVMALRRMWIVEGLVTVSDRAVTAVAYPTILAFLTDILAAAVIAFFLSGVYSSRMGVRDLLHSLDPFSQPVHWYWWAIAVSFYPVIKETPGVVRFQAIQTGSAKLTIRLETTMMSDMNSVWQILEQRVHDYLTTQGLVNVSVEQDATPPARDARSGKFRHVWAELQEDYQASKEQVLSGR